jgi:DNA repair protein RadC
MPRERLEQYGPEALKDAELLAILIGTGYKGRNVLEVAGAILKRYPKEELVNLPFHDLIEVRGIGKAKASLLIAAFELSKRAFRQGIGLLPAMTRPEDAVALITDLQGKLKEHFIALYLNARNQLLRRETVSIGTLSSSLVHPREVFQPGVALSAAGIILAHNHPSGDTTPSKEDVQLTDRMVKAGEIMGIEILDHLIIGKEGFLSFKEKGYL